MCHFLNHLGAAFGTTVLKGTVVGGVGGGGGVEALLAEGEAEDGSKRWAWEDDGDKGEDVSNAMLASHCGLEKRLSLLLGRGLSWKIGGSMLAIRVAYLLGDIVDRRCSASS